MKEFNAVTTRENIFMLIRHSGITLEEFGNIIGVSKRWVQYLKNGTYNFDIAAIEKASIFFNVAFVKLTTSTFLAPENYRKTLQVHHKNNTEFNKILSENPSIPYLIEFILMKDEEFITTPEMEIKIIKRILEKYGLVYDGSSLSTELQKSDFVACWPHPTKMRTNLYKAKK